MSGTHTKRTKIAQQKYLEELDAGLKTCARCEQRKTFSEFPKKGKYSDDVRSRYSYCKPCHSEYQRILKDKRQFNLTPEDIDTIFQYQNLVCAICKRKPKTMRLQIDHAHKSGLIRGGLCWYCNKGLGIFKDDPVLLQSAADYLLNPPAIQALGVPRYGRPGRVGNKATTAERLRKKWQATEQETHKFLESIEKDLN